MKKFLSLFAVLAVFSIAANAQDAAITNSDATESQPAAIPDIAPKKSAMKKGKFKKATSEQKAKMKAAKKAKKMDKKKARKAKMEQRRKLMKSLTPQQKSALKQEKVRHRQEVEKIVSPSSNK